MKFQFTRKMIPSIVYDQRLVMMSILYYKGNILDFNRLCVMYFNVTSYNFIRHKKRFINYNFRNRAYTVLQNHLTHTPVYLTNKIHIYLLNALI